MSNNIPFYVVNFKNDERKSRMKERFTKCGIEPIFTPGVEVTDPRLSTAPEQCVRTWAIMLQHLDSVRHFYENFPNINCCIICEDDIHISKDLQANLAEIIPQFDQLELDVMMLGYLLSFKIDMTSWMHQKHFQVLSKTPNFTIHRYPNDIWGTQMYMISRKYAQYLLETFTIEYAFNNMSTVPFNSDWIITKNGNRALIYPMIAVEEGVNNSGHYGQAVFHINCHQLHYDPNIHI